MIKYTKDGYLDIPAILDRGYFFNAVVGARGTGKTFGALAHMAQRESNGKFLLVRRTAKQAAAMGNSKTSPFKAVNGALGTNIECDTLDARLGISAFKNGDSGDFIGYGGALSTFAGFRGIDFSDVDIIIYDEFIKEKHERKIQGEGEAFFNLIETVNRNRELQAGKPPVTVLCLANSNDIFNPLFVSLKLVLPAEKLINAGREELYDKDRGLLLYIVQNSPISEQKSKTALYKLVGDGEFTNMAIKNSFNMDESEQIKSLPLKGMKPIAAIGEICVYKRPNGGYYIASKAVGGGYRQYTLSSADRARFKNDYKMVFWRAFYGREMVFETYYTSKLFEEYFIKLSY